MTLPRTGPLTTARPKAGCGAAAGPLGAVGWSFASAGRAGVVNERSAP